MVEYFEAHPKNFVSLIATEACNPPHENAKHGVARGVPIELTEVNPYDDENTEKSPYMIEISSLQPCAPTAYVPSWQAIKWARVGQGKEPTCLDEWLNRKNLEIKHLENTKSPTHVTLNNGRFMIPLEQETEFLTWYAINLLKNSRMWFVEILTPVFRYFVDLDFVQLVPIPERAIHAASKVVQSALLKFYPNLNTDEKVQIMDAQGNKQFVDARDSLRCIVCTTNYKYINAKDGKPEMVKTGIHILWKNVYLTRDDALNIRELIIVDLETTFGKRLHPLNSWHDVVDSSVYGSGNYGTKGSGLRMIGSRKSDTCDQCRGQKKIKSEGNKKCEKCVGNGRLDTGRPYFPLCCLTTFGARDYVAENEYKNSMQDLIMDTKVRTAFQERPEYPEFIIPEHAPRFCNINLRPNKRGRASAADKEAMAGGAQKPLDPSLSKSTKFELTNNCNEWDIILSIVRKAGGSGIYKNVLLHKVTMDSKRSKYIVHITGDMCRYCHNIKREHASNRIYFVIDATGISQRCHDASTEPTPEMQFGCCKDYELILDRIPQVLVPQLFPSCSAAKNFISLHGSSHEHQHYNKFMMDDEDCENISKGSSRNDDSKSSKTGSTDWAAAEMEALMDEEYSLKPSGIKKISKDRKIAKLFKIGDAICQELYKMTWSNTLKTSSGQHVIISNQKEVVKFSKKVSLAIGDHKYGGGRSEQYALDPSALGAKGNSAMIELGFKDVAAIVAGTEEMHEDAKKQIIPIGRLLSQVFHDLKVGIEIAMSLPLEIINTFGGKDDEVGDNDVGCWTFDALISLRISQITSIARLN
jgi:hypothetical protein